MNVFAWAFTTSSACAVAMSQAVDDLDGLVDSLIKSYELKLLPASLDLFTKREYLLAKRKRMTVATPGQRIAFIERELERDRDLLLIDVAHHLYATYQAGQPVQWFLGRWTRDELLAVLEHLYRKSGDRVWRSLAELTRSAPAPGTKPLL